MDFAKKWAIAFIEVQSYSQIAIWLLVFQIAQLLSKPKTLAHFLSVDLMRKNINDWAKINKNKIAAAMLEFSLSMYVAK